MTKYGKVYRAIVERGEKLTTKQITSRYGIANPRDAIYELRKRFDIALVSETDGRGKVKQKYAYTGKLAATA